MSEDQDLEQIREKKARQAYQQAQVNAQREEQIRGAIAQMLEPDAYSRLMFVRQKNPNLFAKAVQTLAYLQQGGQLQSRVTEEQIVKLLAKVAGPRKETKITFRRKAGDE